MGLIFQQIELLPIAYFVILMCVVCAGLVGKAFGSSLIEALPKPFATILAKPVAADFTADAIVNLVFEPQILSRMRQILFTILGRLIDSGSTKEAYDFSYSLPDCLTMVFGGKYWSGCPPKCAA